MQALWIVLALVALATAAVLAYLLLTRFIASMEGQNKRAQQGVVKHDWLSTGRIDFATRLDAATEQNKELQDEFKLLVEERRVVESIAGNENLEIQWRLATLSEAKAVVTQYHKYLSDNSLIKSIPDTPILSSSPAPRSRLVQPDSNIVASSDGGSGSLSH
jgi:hypothetical protein